jgi:hypothetical protein
MVSVPVPSIQSSLGRLIFHHDALPHEKSASVLFTYPPPLEVVSNSATRSPLRSCSFAQRTEVASMRSLRQIFHEAIGGRCCRFGRTVPHQTISVEANVGARVNLQSRRALLKQFAPQYHEAASAQKGALLDTYVQVTGYHRGSGMWLLNHAEDVLHAPAYKRASHYGLEVQHALFLVWHIANRICAKRLIPFLPTLLEALERHEHLHLTEECRSQLLSMSDATADRLLRSQRTLGLRGLSTTRAGTLLKQQIPIRTFEEWKETRPGFLEADLVAHCGTDIEGGYLYTLTLTDVATGWTECLPLLYRMFLSSEMWLILTFGEKLFYNVG